MHIDRAGARKVVLTAPGGDAVDATVVIGVNDDDYLPEAHHVVSAASCTTTCAAPMADPIVSTDLIGDPASCVLDSGLTRANGTLVSVFGWYDNEWGYAQRVIDLVEHIARTLPDR